MTKIPYMKWVMALSSGDYNQTKGTLKGQLPDGGTGYCCLGVLAEIMGYDVKEVGLLEGSSSEYSSQGPLGIYEDFRNVMGKDIVDTLITYNDDGWSFKEIADYIEKEIENAQI